MTQAILLQNELLPRTTPSSSDEWLTKQVNQGASTATATTSVYRVVLPRLHDVLPAGFYAIDDVVSRQERHPKRLEAIRAARRKLALEIADDTGGSLQKLRLAKGLSQTELAVMVGTTQSHIARIESGRSDVQVGTLNRLANALDVEAGELIKVWPNSRYGK